MLVEQMMAPRAADVLNDGGTSGRPSISLINALGGGRTTSGVRVTEGTAEGIPVVYACVNILADSIGQLPLKLYKRLPQGGKEPDPSHPLYSLLHDLPNPEMTSQELREVMTRHLKLWGNAYAEIERNTAGQITALWPLAPWYMSVDRESVANRLRYRYDPHDDEGGFTRVWDPYRPPVMHLRINSLDGIHGRSPVRILMDSLGLTKAAEEFGARFFGNDATPRTLLKHKGRLSDKAKQHLRESFEQKFGGVSKSHRLAVIEEGMEVERVGMPLNEAQFLETRKLQIEEGARMYRVPLWMLQAMEKSTSWGKGIEQMGIGFVTYTLMPDLTRFQQAIYRDLLTIKSAATHEAAFVVNALVRGDFKTRMDGYWVGRQAGMFNPNEMRALEDMRPRDDDGGEEYLTPANMTPDSNGRPAGHAVTVDDDDDATEEQE